MPGEAWLYRAVGQVADLATDDTLVSTTTGCTQDGQSAPRSTYQNAAVARAGASASSDVSYYCNPTEEIVFKKLTNGADAYNANGLDVPEVEPKPDDYVDLHCYKHR